MMSLHWNFEPSVLLGVAALSAAYGLANGPLYGRIRQTPPLQPRLARMRMLAFYLGMLCVLAALVSPLDELADQALFSAHMAQHLLLTFIAPPLWLLGIPPWLVTRLIPSRLLARLTHPLVAFTVFNGVMWFWHLPAVYDAALQAPALHIVEHLMFMGSAVLGWWPVLGPGSAGRMALSLRLAYLIPSLFSCTALAALITLSAARLYPFYGDSATRWGLTPLTDQQAGGLLMWWVGDMIYLILIVGVVKALFDSSLSEKQQVIE
jgi:cytochrome c oxidase assembly factor CtaG